MNPEPSYVADIRGVREVTIEGSADPGFWGPRLAVEGLVPALEAGRARLLLISGDMKFMGTRFREFSLSVRVDPPRPGWGAGVFLEQAFNSNRFFAWSERTFFHAPYFHGLVEVESILPARIRVKTLRGGHFLARMGPLSAENVLPPVEDVLEGPAYLPSSPRGVEGQGRVFYGRAEGCTYRIPWRPGHDLLEISCGNSGLQVLLESAFLPEVWVIRPDARHCKSRTLLFKHRRIE